MQKAACEATEQPNLTEQGFNERIRGVHTSRTMMFAELDSVMQTLGPEVNPAAVRQEIIEGNVLGKSTRSGRETSAGKLIALYSFNLQQPLFFAFQLLWKEGVRSRPMLAVLFALSRDAVLRASADTVLDTPLGSTLANELIYKSLAAGFAAKYAEKTLRSTTKNIASSWRQSGHIRGRDPALRVKAVADYNALAFALLIGYLRGLRGQNLLSSEWVRLLDFDASELEVATAEAHRHGLITSRKIGEVFEITPGPYLLHGSAA